MTQVVEDPTGLNFSTSYTYDTLDDLAKVTQGSQQRYFFYDSMKRLIRARNVEQDSNAALTFSDPLTGNTQWSVGYSYDLNSNLSAKTDARAVTTTYIYDELNRVTRRAYSDTTPEINYFYDNQSLPAGAPSGFSRGAAIGRLVAVTYGGATSSAGNYQGYDSLGRVTQSFQKTDSQSYGLSYGYNLADEMTSQTYPSARVITTGYDTAGRISAVSGQKTGEGNKSYASQMSYSPHGAMSAMRLGNQNWEHTAFNSRLQPTEIGLGISSADSSILKLEYTYNTTGQANNNGNVRTQKMTAGGTLILTQSYGYDPLNRLQSVSENGSPGGSPRQKLDWLLTVANLFLKRSTCTIQSLTR